jgi:hypothetical protein
VLAITLRIDSNVACVRCGTWSHVRLRRAMGAVPNAEIIDVSVEKLFKTRQRYSRVSNFVGNEKIVHVVNSRRQQKRSA